MADPLPHALSVRELARRWRCRPARVRAMIRSGTLAAIRIGDAVRVTPEAVRECEAGVLAVKPKRKRRRELIPAEVIRMLDD